MGSFPEVFVPVIARRSTDTYTIFTMPRYEEPVLDQLEEALLEAGALLPKLWGYDDYPYNPRCNEELSIHLHTVAKSFFIKAASVDSLIGVLRKQKQRQVVCIHGDPTLANCVHGPNGWRWIDPLIRDYILGDPHVDLGKLFQSCMGYEAVLLGQPPRPNYELMRRLADMLHLDFQLGMCWCAVHFIRLLPYQRPEDVLILSRLFERCYETLR